MTATLARLADRIRPPDPPGQHDVRCPQCHSLLATYGMTGDGPAVTIIARCRRCRCLYEARLQSDGATATLAPNSGRVPESR